MFVYFNEGDALKTFVSEVMFTKKEDNNKSNINLLQNIPLDIY